MDKPWGLTVHTGNYIQSLGIERDGRQYEEKNVCIYKCIYICICITGSLCCTAEIDTTM